MSAPAPPGYRIRRPTTADAARVAALIRAFELEVDDEAETTAQDVVAGWQDLELSRDAWVVETDGGDLAAHATLARRGDVLEGDGYVHPAHCGRGLGRLLIALTEDAAAGLDGFTAIRNGVSLRDPGALRLMADHGYAPARYFWSMGIVLDGLPPPATPQGVTLDTVNPDEWREFHAVTEQTFADHWGHVPRTFDCWLERARAHPDHDPTLWFAARKGGRMIGTANCGLRDGRGYVADLGVLSDCRGQGIGRALLVHAMRAFWGRGLPDVRLHVDTANATGATALYTSVGMRALAEYCIYEKPFADSGRTGR
jgi:ribosomal protein S18 acetylase RimI-like enzyme